MSGDLSVIMPLYNCERYVGQTIQLLLDNCDGLLELIVVDDGSTDRGPEIAAAFGEPVRVIHQQNAGPSAARNRGLREARGELIGFLDADDFWVAAKPDPRRAAIADGADVAHAHLVIVAGDPPRPFAGEGATVQLGSIILRRDALDRVGPLDETKMHAEDVDWLMRMREVGLRIDEVPEVVLHYRLREGSLTRDREDSRAGLTKALRDSLVRRGKIGGAS